MFPMTALPPFTRLTEWHSPFHHQSRFLRFLVVGGLSTGLSYGLYTLLMLVGLNYAIASFGALVAGILFNFKTQGALVFGNSDNRLLWRFAVCWLAIYVVNVSLIGKFIALGIDEFVAGLLPIPLTTAFSYFMQRFFVFGRSNPVATSQGAHRPGVRADGNDRTQPRIGPTRLAHTPSDGPPKSSRHVVQALQPFERR
jgi:putative flippase GtrA